MVIFGLHIIDILILVLYFAVMIYIGKRSAKAVKDQDDFYMGGRKFGKLLQFFLNFGSMVDANNATALSSAIFKNGVAGVWVGFQTLFMTPYYWFMYGWFRRARLLTMAELFEDRFGCKLLPILYSGFYIFIPIITIGWGFLVSSKLVEPLIVKPESAYTVEERQMVADYNEYIGLKQNYTAARLTPAQQERFAVLKNLYEQGRLKSYISYLKPYTFYLIYGATVGLYIILGGLTAAAATGAVQGLLIVTFSVILIPFGLVKLGGFTGLHQKVPEHMFRLFGSQMSGAFTWYSMLAILFASWVQIHGLMTNMSMAGATKSELDSNIGAVSAGYAKRLMIICWAFCALIAVGIFGNSLSDPDASWGALSKNLLGPGTMGLMLAGILAANMSTIASMTVSLSGLFVRNLYALVAPDRTEKHYVFVSRIVLVVVLLLGVYVAMYATGIIKLIVFLLPLGVTFGTPVFLLFIWRRLTGKAVVIEVIICTVLICILPLVLTAIPAVKQSPYFTQMTNERVIYSGDGQTKKVFEPVSLYFDSVSRLDPYDANSPLIGRGPFNVEVFIVGLMGFDIKSLSPAGLLTVRYMFDGLLPFILLFVLSYLTKPDDAVVVNRFYAKLKTVVAPTPQQDANEVQKSYENPHRFDHLKLFPHTSWEFCRWKKVDYIGFGCSVLTAFLILGLFWVLLNIGTF